MEVKKGDVVGRVSYGKDILFKVENIIKTRNGASYAILKRNNYSNWSGCSNRWSWNNGKR